MPGQERSFFLYAKNGQLGFQINNDLDVILVQKGSMADGKICIGHKILRVNVQVIITKTQFERLINHHAGQGITIVVWHDSDKVKQFKQEIKRPGYEIKDIVIVWNPISQQKLGLAVKGEGQNVYVTAVPPNSVCSMYLQEGDRILEVDGWPTLDKDMTRNFLVQAFRYNNRATLKIERAVGEESKSVVSNILTAATNWDPSVIMETDVVEIMQKQLKKLEEHDDKRITGLYKSGSSNKELGMEAKRRKSSEDQKHVQIQSKVTDNVIGMDNSAMAGVLLPVPPRTPQYQPPQNYQQQQ